MCVFAYMCKYIYGGRVAVQILSAADLMAEQDVLVSNLCGTLALSSADGKALLKHCGWNKAKALSLAFDRPDDLAALGITPGGTDSGEPGAADTIAVGDDCDICTLYSITCFLPPNYFLLL